MQVEELLSQGQAAVEAGDRAGVLAVAESLAGSEAADPDARRWIANALLTWAAMLDQAQQYADALRLLDLTVSVAQAGGDVYLDTKWARALVRKGWVLTQLERSDDACALFDEVARRFGASTAPDLVEAVSLALARKGEALLRGGDARQALDALAGAIEHAHGLSDADAEEIVIDATLLRGRALEALDEVEEAAAAYDDVAQRSAGERAARALRLEAMLWSRAGKHEPALASYDTIVRQHRDDPDTSVREHVASALVGRGHELEQLDRSVEACAAYEELAAFPAGGSAQIEQLRTYARRRARALTRR